MVSLHSNRNQTETAGTCHHVQTETSLNSFVGDLVVIIFSTFVCWEMLLFTLFTLDRDSGSAASVVLAIHSFCWGARREPQCLRVKVTSPCPSSAIRKRLVCVCVCVCVHVCVCAICEQMPTESRDGMGSPVARVTRSCSLPKSGGGNWTPVLCL